MPRIDAIDFCEIGNIPGLIKDFLNCEMPDLSNQHFDLENVEKQIERKKNNYTEEARKTLCGVIERQFSDLSMSSKQKENLEFLAQENTFTVVTGHQLNVFSGPVYFIYKIAQTIKSAEIMNAQLKENKIVPVFWLATEDHDFDEIKHFRDEKTMYTLHEKSGGAVGRIKITSNTFIDQFEKDYKDYPFGKELIELLKKAYKVGNTLTKATQIVIQELFSDKGLLMIDGDDPALKIQMKEIFADEISNSSLKKCTKETVTFLKNKYGKVQVNPREINLFYLTKTRNRIDPNGENYRIDGTNQQFSEQEILEELENFPERFSPNALMRPVFQEKVLPNIAYIGGNAEVMYWLELKNYFKALQLPFPLLIPRNSMLFLKEKTLQKTEKLGLKLKDFFADYKAILDSKLLENNELIGLLEDKEKEIEESFSQIKQNAESTDPTFGNLVKAEEIRQLKSYARMKKRLLRAERIKQGEKFSQFQNLFLEVNPEGIWQERQYNFCVFYRKNGKDWLDEVYDHIFVDKSSLVLMRE